MKSVLDYAFSVGKIRALEKFLIKSAVFQEAIESDLQEALRLFVESGLYSEEILHAKDSRKLETVLNQELSRLKKLISDLILDKELLGLLESNILERVDGILKIYHSQFLKEYLMYLKDLHNIKTFLRLYILKEPQDKLKNMLIYEGFIKKDVFLEFYRKDLAIFIKRLEYVHEDSRIIDYASILREPIKTLEQKNSFIALEKAINDFLVLALRPAKYISFGPEPVLTYYFARVNEMNLVRMIILAKFNDVSSDAVKERLNFVYA